MSTTAWRFAGTEGADDAVARIKQLDMQDMINAMDVAVLRWPDYAPGPITQEHVITERGKILGFIPKRHPVIDTSMIDTVKGDLRPGTSAMVLLSSDADIDAVVQAFRGQPLELLRTDMSVPQQDRLRQAVNEARERDEGGTPV